MSPGPTPPRRSTYRGAIAEQQPSIVETEQTPRSMPPQGEVQLRGSGWKLNVPAVVLTGLITALGARMLPTNTATDSRIEDFRAEQRVRDQRDAERWEDVRSRLRGIEDRLSRLEDARSNDRLSLEDRLSRLEKK